MHVVAGAGGHKLSRIRRRQWPWVDYAEREYGFVRLEVRALEGGSLSLAQCSAAPRVWHVAAALLTA